MTFCTLVPLFDGHSPDGKAASFSFTLTDFNNLRCLPHFVGEDGALDDLPKEAIVAVGYTLRTYKARSGNAHYLSTNLMFAILLSIPNHV